jgi:hypothetical protein
MSGENQTTEKTRDRFDLEQDILECWKVTTDIKVFVEQGGDLSVLSAYYDQKFERLWSTFEQLVAKKALD